MGRRISYREALREALREAMQADSRVFLMGEDVGCYGGSYAVSKGLLEEFGPERIRDTPLSELGFVGAGVGECAGSAGSQSRHGDDRRRRRVHSNAGRVSRQSHLQPRAQDRTRRRHCHYPFP